MVKKVKNPEECYHKEKGEYTFFDMGKQIICLKCGYKPTTEEVASILNEDRKWRKELFKGKKKKSLIEQLNSEEDLQKLYNNGEEYIEPNKNDIVEEVSNDDLKKALSVISEICNKTK